MISLIIGILAPIMSVEIFKDLPVFGFTVFKYDSKSIYTTITKLWILEKYFLSTMIMSSSIIIPFVKTIVLYYSVLNSKHIKYIDILSKWSMADVFVISLLLTNLSLNTDNFTNAETKIAIYFFSVYVVISILVSQLIKRDNSYKLLQSTK